MGRLTQSFKQLTSKNPWPEFPSASRRTGHGGIAWVTETSLMQPQDGAAIESSRVVDIATSLRNGGTLSNEPEDARLTGGTRSLLRRVLGLNIRKPKPLKTALSVASKSTKSDRPVMTTSRVA